MNEVLYMVVDTNGNPVGQHMELSHALIFVRGLMHEFWQEPMLEYRIVREPDKRVEEVKRYAAD